MRAGPGPPVTQKIYDDLLLRFILFGLRCARADRTRSTSHIKSQRLIVIDNTVLRFAVRPCGLGLAPKPHTKSTISCYLLFVSSVCGASIWAGPGPQAIQQVNDQQLFTIHFSSLRCARAGRTQPTSHTASQRLLVIYEIVLRFAVRPCGPAPAHKPHTVNATIS